MCTKIVQNTDKNKYEGFDDIFAFIFFFYVGWGADKKKPFYLGRLAHLLFITFIILYVFIIITIIIYALQAMESRWRC